MVGGAEWPRGSTEILSSGLELWDKATLVDGLLRSDLAGDRRRWLSGVSKVLGGDAKSAVDGLIRKGGLSTMRG